jgi:hypothetical protein
MRVGSSTALATDWPAEAARQLDALIAAHAHSGAYAVFDADNSSYHLDLVDAYLPFLEARGVLTRERLDPTLRLIPFIDRGGEQHESLASYYQRLCAIDDHLSFPWASQVFSGFTLAEHKAWLDDMLADGTPIESVCLDAQGTPRRVITRPPRFLRGMQALYRRLMDHGIAVYVISAAAEELVRMILADPKHGYGTRPEHVIGVTLLLRERASGDLTTARHRIAAGAYDPAAFAQWELTSTLCAPLPWYEGKLAAIHTHIHRWRKPILVVGDTPVSDGPMLLHATDVERGGLRLWVDRKPGYLAQIQALQREHAQAQREHGLPVTAERNWIVVRPEQLGIA